LRQSPAQRAQCAVRLEGDLDADALEKAVQLVVRRHEILRTAFHRRQGSRTPVQVIEEDARPELRRVDLSGEPAGTREERVEELFRHEADLPFDLARLPLCRASLVCLGPRRHVLLLSLPALCADAATLHILLREVCSGYEAAARGGELTEAPVQYADLAEWQNEFLESEDGALGRDFWRARGLGDPHALKLPFEQSPAGEADFAPRRVSSGLDAGVVDRIREHAARYGATPAAFILAGWQELLRRLTGHDEILLGIVSGGRKYEELEDVPGLFARCLPLRTRTAPEVAFGDAVRRMHEASGEAQQWEEWFGDEYLAWDEGRDEQEKFFPLCFEAAKSPARCSAGNVSFELYRQYVCADRFKLKLSWVEADDSAAVELHYDSSLFGRGDAETLLAQLASLLESAAENPEEAARELSALGPAERRRLLVELNDTRADYRRDRCVHQLIEEQARRTPDAAALDFAGRRVTYAELDERANRLAHHLRKLGVGAETRVGLYLGRSVELVVGLLAVLKAGGAYVPLDPEYPKQRVEFILNDASAQVILTTARLAEGLSAGGCTVVRLDADRELVESEPGTPPPGSPAPANLAYVIYTSGSTGSPKGTMVPHSGLVNYLSWAAAAYGAVKGAGSPVHSSAGFDLTVTSLFTPLLTGRCAFLLPEVGAVEALGSALSAQPGFSLVKITPAHLEALSYSLAGRVRPGQTAALIVGGEALFGESLAPWREGAPDTRVVNEYGPTETVVGCCVYQFPAGEARPGPVPIGRPIANTRIYLLDERGRPVPAWATGEIYIGGEGVTRGYLNRPALTAERFVPDPFSTEPGARLYRTGDLARFLPGGDIEYLGRADYQLKIRGYRVEPGEVEAVLCGHPNVREAVVLASRGRGGLMACLTVAEDSAPAASELRAFLKERLPEYMIPGAFVCVEEMPLTAHGKVDRRALEALDAEAPRRAQAGETFGTPVEEVLAAVWAETLGVERAGPSDNFLESGGHSLLALRLTSRLRDAFNVELTLDEVLGAPTLSDLARKIEDGISAASLDVISGIEPAPRDGRLPLSFAQQRLWILDQISPGSPAYNVPLAVRMSGAFDIGVFGRALSEVVRRHESLRTTFAVAGDRPVQVVHPPRPLTPDATDLTTLPEDEREARVWALAREEAHAPFDLSAGPLVRARLLKLSDEEHVLLLTMHHIISDGWSVGILMRELSALYESFRAGRPSPLAELPVQYADFAHWQRRWLEGEVLEAQLTYWRKELAGDLPLLQLPTDRPRPAVQTYSGAVRSVLLSERLSAEVKALGRREGVTLFMTLLAAFKVLLHRYTGQTDILVGAPVANRRRSELEPLIGLFVNTLVLRTELSGGESFRALLRRVRETALRAYVHQDIPFEKLVEELQPQRSLSHTPLFQVMFVLENEPRQETQLTGLSLRSLEGGGGTAKYDLTLSIEEGERGLAAAFEYNTDLFDGATVERMLGHFETLLEGIVADPDERISRLPLLTESERHQLLVEWNETASSRPAHPCVHQLFEEQAARTPEATALVGGGRRLTYRELNERADLLARYLMRRGVGPEVLVGVLMGRSAEMLVALLGVLKAGGAYVPLDPSYPAERLRFMLDDSAVRVLLTQEGLRQSLPGDAAEVVCVDSQWEEIERAGGGGDGEAVRPVAPDNLAYVIYTSGSTGRPKGVGIEHGSAATLIAWAGGVFSDEECAGVLASTSICFDLSVFELFVPLGRGGKVILADNALHLPELEAAGEVTLVNTVPSAIAELLRASGLPPSVRTVNLAGEALQNRLVQAIYSQPQVERVYNLYGPTEDTTYSTFSLMERGGDYLPPIGRPVSGTRVYLLDADLQPVPAGVAGELYLGGEGLARGYLKRPALTAERFVPDPFSGEAGERLYRTGDLARYLPGGVIEYLGRVDHQVKIRGFRIELGEIEAVLNNHPDVGGAVVVAGRDANGEARLVAYVVARPGAAASVAQARAFIQEKLPHYMTPSAFVLLDALPLNSNGKVDRKALPEPEEANRMPGRRPHVEPRTHIEKELARIWRELLGVERVGMDDNFFELGGHSLTMTQLSSRVRAGFQTDVPLLRLFDAPTLGGMAEVITDGLVEQGTAGDIDEMLNELRDLSPEEVRMLLEGEG
jgi:amino acid adenylation domain-containing protein